MAIAKANQNMPILRLMADGFSQGCLIGFFAVFFDILILDSGWPRAEVKIHERCKNWFVQSEKRCLSMFS
jgi:hypothetical protein